MWPCNATRPTFFTEMEWGNLLKDFGCEVYSNETLGAVKIAGIFNHALNNPFFKSHADSVGITPIISNELPNVINNFNQLKRDIVLSNQNQARIEAQIAADQKRADEIDRRDIAQKETRAEWILRRLEELSARILTIQNERAIIEQIISDIFRNHNFEDLVKAQADLQRKINEQRKINQEIDDLIDEKNATAEDILATEQRRAENEAKAEAEKEKAKKEAEEKESILQAAIEAAAAQADALLAMAVNALSIVSDEPPPSFIDEIDTPTKSSLSWWWIVLLLIATHEATK